MLIFLKNKQTLNIDEFSFKCCIGKKGSTNNKKEGDFKTPKGIFNLGNLYYRADREKKPKTKLKCIKITKNMICCNDVKNKKYYNKILKKKTKLSYETLHRKDDRYNFVLPIKYNLKKKIIGKGSCIFFHLTNNYKGTAGCIALKRDDFIIFLKLLKTDTKILIK
jgi:L,D-peptidoglycan transpeptidase YkuD (ErfK/YbiS/YcfS/YnhG family)